jgi:hypothetical protein
MGHGLYSSFEARKSAHLRMTAEAHLAACADSPCMANDGAKQASQNRILEEA